MAVCDVCGSPGKGKLLSASQMRDAVFKRGFNPFTLGLASSFLLGQAEAYAGWKDLVQRDTSDWNVCARCLAALEPYLAGTPAGAGMHQAARPFDELTARLAAVSIPLPPPRRWWEFWKKP